MKDLRDKLAKCRDEWMLSREGIKCQDGSTSGRYLRNRLERAFVAGWNAHEALAKTQDMKESK